jgi:hypothetical protein
MSGCAAADVKPSATASNPVRLSGGGVPSLVDAEAAMAARSRAEVAGPATSRAAAAASEESRPPDDEPRRALLRRRSNAGTGGIDGIPPC